MVRVGEGGWGKGFSVHPVCKGCICAPPLGMVEQRLSARRVEPRPWVRRAAERQKYQRRRPVVCLLSPTPNRDSRVCFRPVWPHAPYYCCRRACCSGIIILWRHVSHGTKGVQTTSRDRAAEHQRTALPVRHDILLADRPTTIIITFPPTKRRPLQASVHGAILQLPGTSLRETFLPSSRIPSCMPTAITSLAAAGSISIIAHQMRYAEACPAHRTDQGAISMGGTRMCSLCTEPCRTPSARIQYSIIIAY